MKKKFYNPELNKEEIYTEVWISERVDVKDEKGLLVKNHYWKDNSGELWADFDTPMENVYRSFDAYRKRKNFLTPNQIRDIRTNLKMTVREFSNLLGISASTLTKIENNRRIQTKYQDQLFRLIALSKDHLEELKDRDDEVVNDINRGIKGSRYVINNDYYKNGGYPLENYEVNKEIGVSA